MITDFILNAVFSGIGALIGLIPAWSLPTDGPGSVSSLVGMLHTMNGVFPVIITIWGILAVVSLKLILQGWDAIVFVYHQFWGGD